MSISAGIIVAGTFMALAFVGMLICARKQRTQPRAQIYAVLLLFVVLGAGGYILFHNEENTYRPEWEQKYIKAAATVLGRDLAKRFDGKKALIIAEFNYRDNRWQQAQIEGLKEGFGKRIADIVIDSPATPKQPGQPQPAAAIPEPQMMDMVTAKDFDQLISRHPDCPEIERLSKKHDDIGALITKESIADAIILDRQLDQKDQHAEDSLLGRFIRNFSVFNQISGFNSSPLEGYWQYRPFRGNYYLLFRKDAIFSTLRKIVNETDSAIPSRLSLMLLTDHNAYQGLKAVVGQKMPHMFVCQVTSEKKMPASESPGAGLLRICLVVLVLCLTLASAFILSRTIHTRLRLADLKNDRVATVSHELKTPLASSRVMIETLQDNPGLDPEKVKDYLARLDHENRRLCDLVDRFLTFSRMEKERYQFNFSVVSSDDVKTSISTRSICPRYFPVFTRWISICPGNTGVVVSV